MNSPAELKVILEAAGNEIACFGIILQRGRLSPGRRVCLQSRAGWRLEPPRRV